MSDHDGDLRAGLENLIRALHDRRVEAADRAKQGYATDWRLDYFFRGVLKTYDEVIADLREFLDSGDQNALPIPAPPLDYLILDEVEIGAILNRAGVYSRSITVHGDGAVTAIFSRMQPTPTEERLLRLRNADPRIVILEYGKLSATGEPFIDFAFTADPR